mmetsp:Transcript_44446/g.71188  ORF Transcript_44446/g.71188 Transcript_44446/m.71188 type:complete len:244 (+) Transcript_44446:29-760(+)
MAQKLKLEVAGNAETFERGEKLLGNDLQELGLEENTDHMKITFDEDRTVRYSMCMCCIVSLASCMWPITTMLFTPCLWYSLKKWAQSRIAAVTDKQLVLKQGSFGCGCWACCWNESTKSVPLNQITDLQVQQGCVQRCFDIREIRVETASATKEVPELVLIGLHDPLEVRAQILRVRDSAVPSSLSPHQQQSSQQQQVDTKQLEQIISSQQETMLQIKDVLQDMRTALISMDNKMNANEANAV